MYINTAQLQKNVEPLHNLKMEPVRSCFLWVFVVLSFFLVCFCFVLFAGFLEWKFGAGRGLWCFPSLKESSQNQEQMSGLFSFHPITCNQILLEYRLKNTETWLYSLKKGWKYLLEECLFKVDLLWPKQTLHSHSCLESRAIGKSFGDRSRTVVYTVCLANRTFVFVEWKTIMASAVKFKKDEEFLR